MARLLEHHSKQLLRKLKIPVPLGEIASTPAQAAEIAQQIGFPVAVKGLIPVGKRGKAGAIGFAATKEEVLQQAEQILGMTVSFYPIEALLIEQKLAIKQELYLSITIDKASQSPVIIASTLGGIDIEELSREHPEKVSKTSIDPLIGLPEYKTVEIWSDLGLTGKLLRQASTILMRLYQMFVNFDAVIVEINPLTITEEDALIAAACVLSIDENAVSYTHLRAHET